MIFKIIFYFFALVSMYFFTCSISDLLGLFLKIDGFESFHEYLKKLYSDYRFNICIYIILSFAYLSLFRWCFK